MRFNAAALCRLQKANDKNPQPICVPELNRSTVASGPRYRYASLDEVFLGLGEAFAEFEFRDAVRMAGRRDLCRNSIFAADRASSVQGTWKDPAPSLTRVLRALGQNAPNGEEFLSGLAALRLKSAEGATTRTGHWMDIVGIRNRKINHAWHQDAAGDYNQLTIMLGFPLQEEDDNDYTNNSLPGVFSHLVPLTHSLFRHPEQTVGPLSLEPQDFGFNGQQYLPEFCIVRPVFKRGQEILLYHDTSTIHSAPDVARREALWRFM